MRFRFRARVLILAGLLLLGVCAGAAPEGFRNIASVQADAYFNGDWRLELTNVFLARIVPALTAVAKLSRVDTAGWNQNLIFLGPVVSFTKNLYLEAVYGLGIDSDGVFTHKFDVNFNYETDANATSVGLRADWLPASGYCYFIPSVSGKLHPLPALGLFGKFFLSMDSEPAVTVDTLSFWGQADYRFSPLLGARAGFTMSHADTFGYSLAAGLDFFFRPAVILKYTFQYLSDSIGIADLEPHSGIENALMLDLRF
jgi:hypothetical protein